MMFSTKTLGFQMKLLSRPFGSICAILIIALSFLTWSCATQSKKGIVVAVNDNYAHNYFIASLAHLRDNLKCQLPIEIWHSGDELSSGTKDILSKFSKVTFKDISSILNVDPKEYRGFQIKPKIIELSDFNEVLLIDADVFFYENPEILFSTPAYVNTGAFFFSDLPHEFPAKGDKILFTLERYMDRRNFITSLIPKPSPYILPDMKELWSHDIPTFQKPFIGDMQESGCVAFNKTMHKKSLDEILTLNENLDNTYKYIYGDKETFWLGCEIAGNPYFINKQRPLTLLSGQHVVTIMQFLDDKLFYQQKNPIPLDTQAFFIKYARQFVVYIPDQEPSKIEKIRSLTLEEKNKIEQAFQKTIVSQ